MGDFGGLLSIFQYMFMIIFANFSYTRLLGIVANRFYTWERLEKDQESSKRVAITVPTLLVPEVLLRAFYCHKCIKPCNRNERFFNAINAIDKDMKQ